MQMTPEGPEVSREQDAPIAGGMPVKIVWDANGEAEQTVMVNRHLNLFWDLCDAAEAAIASNDRLQADWGWGPMTGVEISGVMANAVISILQERGVTLGQYLKDLFALGRSQGWTQ
jgi:hypothetical protein